MQNLQYFRSYLSFLSLCTARPSFEYHRQVYFVHSRLQDESLQETISKLGFFNLAAQGVLSLHRGHPVNVPIQRTMHLSSVIPANVNRESVFGHQIFPCRERGSNLEPLAPEATFVMIFFLSFFDYTGFTVIGF